MATSVRRRAGCAFAPVRAGGGRRAGWAKPLPSPAHTWGPNPSLSVAGRCHLGAPEPNLAAHVPQPHPISH
jgi:hypothetical protein